MRFGSLVFCVAALVPTAMLAQEEISPEQMVELLRTSPIECAVPVSGGQDCAGVEEFHFLTDTRGFSRATFVMEVGDKEYLRATMVAPFRVSDDGFCMTNTKFIEDAHFEIVEELAYLGDFKRYELTEAAEEWVQKQMVKPMMAMFEAATACTKHFIPEDQSKPNEITSVTYLDGEAMEEVRVVLMGQSEASRIILTPEE